MSRVLGIDHGTVRVGLALSDELGMVAHPLKTLDGGPEVERQIADMVRQKRVETVVIGMPLPAQASAPWRDDFLRRRAPQQPGGGA